MEERLRRGISFGSEDDARLVLEQYRQQIAAGKTAAGVAASASADGQAQAGASSAGEGAAASSAEGA